MKGEFTSVIRLDRESEENTDRLWKYLQSTYNEKLDKVMFNRSIYIVVSKDPYFIGRIYLFISNKGFMQAMNYWRSQNRKLRIMKFYSNINDFFNNNYKIFTKIKW